MAASSPIPSNAAANPPKRGPRTAQVMRTEEKGSDEPGITLLLDAFQKTCDVAVVISNDSDLRVPIRIAAQELGVRVGIINPHPTEYRSRVVRGTFFKQQRVSVLGECQLTQTLTDAQGTIRKPIVW